VGTAIVAISLVAIAVAGIALAVRRTRPVEYLMDEIDDELRERHDTVDVRRAHATDVRPQGRRWGRPCDRRPVGSAAITEHWWERCLVTAAIILPIALAYRRFGNRRS
jgi:hypothetical protein